MYHEKNLKKTKTPFWRNFVLLTRYHATPVVILFFNPTHVTYVTSHHTVVTRYVIIVTYGTSCHTIGHLMMYCECYEFERAFFILRHFLLYTSSCFLRLLWGWQLNLKLARLHADLRNIAPAPLHKRVSHGRFYSSVRISPETLNFMEQYLLLVLNLHLNRSIC